MRLSFLILVKLLGLNLGKKYNVITNHLLGKTFKLQEKYVKDKLIVLKYFYKLFALKVIYKIKKIECNHVIFDSQRKSKTIREKYLRLYSKIKQFEFISYEELLFFRSKTHKFFYITFSIPFLLLYFVTSQFFENKSSFALLIEYPLVLNNFITKIKGNHKKEIFYFSIYERESNFFAYQLMKSKHKIYKILSDTPIAIWNKNILTNQIIVCNKYQQFEIDLFSDTIIFEGLKFWGPELSFRYIKTYNKSVITPTNTIGFYSTASWIRNQDDEINQGIDFFEMEKKVLLCLRKLLIDNEYKVTIFLHPKEIRSKSMDLINLHYHKLLGQNANFQISKSKLSSDQLFHLVDLGVAFNSTIIHERIFCGFKSIFFPNNPDFPIQDSPLYNICAKNEKDFLNLIKVNLKMSRRDFFIKNKLTDFSIKF